MKNILSKRKLRNEVFYIKDIIFNILEGLEPYEFVDISINNNNLPLCKKNALLPLACRLIDYDPDVAPNYYYTEDEEYAVAYIESHRVMLGDKEYLIESELLEIDYYDKYIHLKIMNMMGVQEYYIPYNSINYIHAINLECRVDHANHYAMKYNKIQYELYK